MKFEKFFVECKKKKLDEGYRSWADVVSPCKKRK